MDWKKKAKKKNLQWKGLQVGFTFIMLVVAFIPTYLFMLVKYTLQPTDFWQKLLVYGLGLWFLLGWQVIFLILFVILCAFLWTQN